MAPDAGEHLVVLARELDRPGVRVLAEADREDAVDPGFARGRDQLIRPGFAEAEMGVGIDHARV